MSSDEMGVTKEDIATIVAKEILKNNKSIAEDTRKVVKEEVAGLRKDLEKKIEEKADEAKRQIEEKAEEAKKYTDKAVSDLREELLSKETQGRGAEACPEDYVMTKTEYRCRSTVRILGLPIKDNEDEKSLYLQVREVLIDRLHFSEFDVDDFGQISVTRPWSNWDQHPVEVVFASHVIRDEVMVRMAHLKAPAIDGEPQPELRLSAKYPIGWNRLVKKLEEKNKKIREIEDKNGKKAFYAQTRYTMDSDKLCNWAKRLDGESGWMTLTMAAQEFGEEFPEIANLAKN